MEFILLDFKVAWNLNHCSPEIYLFFKNSQMIQDQPSFGITEIEDEQIFSSAKFYSGLENYLHCFQHLHIYMAWTVCICEHEEAECKSKYLEPIYSRFQGHGIWA